MKTPFYYRIFSFRPILKRTHLKTDKKIDFLYIADNADLQDCLDCLQAESLIAIDMEADSYHHYFPKVCLLQCTAGKHNYIIDPLAEVDMKKVLSVLARKSLILHDAGYDLRMLKADYDFRPNEPILDTMLAAKLLGIEKVGLSSLLEQYFDIQVAKHNQKADWSKRPLDPHLLDYAIEDTFSLHALWKILRTQLETKGRLDWHRQFCEFSVQNALDADFSKNDQDHERWRIRGVQKLSPKEMAFFRELWHWREKEAQKVDVPPFRIFENTRLMQLSVQLAAGKTSLRQISYLLPKTCKGKRLEAMKKGIHKAQELPAEKWPQKKKGDASKRLSAAKLRRTEELKKKCAVIAAELELPPQLIVTRSVLEHIVKKEISDPALCVEKRLLMLWQAELVAPVLADSLD